MSEREFETLKQSVAVDEEVPYMRPADIKLIKKFDFDRLIKRNSSTVMA